MLNKINPRFSISLAILAIIIAITFFILFFSSNKAYQTDITIMFIPKSETAAFHSGLIMDNLEKFPRFLSFYKRMIDNNKLADKFEGLTRDEKKKNWSNSLVISRDGTGTIMSIGVISADKEESVLLAKSAVKSLFNTASFYYNIKEDIDLRIIDGPTTSSVFRFWFLYLVISIILGILISLILNVFLEYIIRKLRTAKDTVSNYRKSPEIKREIAEEKEIPYQPRIETSQKRSQAPSNLPIEEEEVINPEELESVPPAGETEKIAESQNIKPDISPEPTDEDLKRRLNQLLRGEL